MENLIVGIIAFLLFGYLLVQSEALDFMAQRADSLF
jgi:hypothetical protein